MGNVKFRQINLKMNDEVQSLDEIVRKIILRDNNSQILVETKIYEKIFGIMNMGPKDSYIYTRVNQFVTDNDTKIQIVYFCEGYSKITLYKCSDFDYDCSKVGMNQIITICAN